VHRQHTALSLQAHERYVERLNRRRGGSHATMQMRFGRGRGPELPDVHEETVRFWWAPPDRLREETASNFPGRARTTIWNGEDWWLYGDALDPITNTLLDDEGRASHSVGGGDRFRPLLDPSALLATVELDEIRPGDGVLHVEARLRDDLEGPQLFHLPLIGGADRFELEVDARLGVVRAITAWLGDDELASTRLDELTLGEAIPDDVFAPPADVRFEAPGGRSAQVTLEEAAAEAPFPVFYVPDLPDGVWRLQAHRNRRPTYTLWLVYHRSDGRDSFTIAQSSELPFEPAEDDERAIALERDGTKLLLQSERLDRQALLDLAASLRRFR
jgi:outer membrane lipoprotein-sorting protein